VGEPDDARTDGDLLAAARQGDTEALDALIRRYQPRVFRFGMKMCGDREEAGDVAQESLLALARHVREFRGDSSVSTWLYAIARNACLKRRRRSKFAPAREESLEWLEARQRDGLFDPAAGPEQAAFAGEIEAALTAAIDALEIGEREVLVLRDIEGLSAPEVAKVLGVSVDAVKSRLHRARVAVRARVAPVLGMPLAQPPAPGCPDILDRFSRYLDGEIGPDVCAQMEAHLASCEACRATCQSLRSTVALCRAMPGEDVPPAVAAAVRDAIRAFMAHPRS
jgi:RNA polymerase sigma-70 factor (ECF subfamily)